MRLINIELKDSQQSHSVLREQERWAQGCRVEKRQGNIGSMRVGLQAICLLYMYQFIYFRERADAHMAKYLPC